VTVHHLQPPPAQREGGLDAAIRGLCASLQNAGVMIDHELPVKLASGAVVHLHGLWQPSFVAAARRCREQHVPYIVSPHGMLEPWAWRHKWWKKWPYYLAVEKRLLRGAAALLATGDQEAARLRDRLPGQRVETLPLGLTGQARPDYEAARARLGWMSEERVLLFLSRLHPKKGLELLLEALASLRADAPLRLVVVGDGGADYVQSLKALAERLASRLPRIDWIGPVWGEKRWPYFQGADLFCLPTYSENFGLAVLEALQVGTPVLTTRTTPWGSRLEPPRGFICDPESGSVAEALQKWLAGPSAAPAVREAIAEWAHERFAWESLTDSYVALYRAVGGG
jgi:glycosyltransferase involved in cell wall biosynthesis